MSNQNINLLASYAKSGSNWSRMVLENYLANSNSPVSIWSASCVANGISRTSFDECLMISSHLLTETEIENLLPDYFNEINRLAKQPVYYKVHSPNTYNQQGKSIFPHNIINGAAYIVRNPLDVVVSFAQHFNLSYDQAIDYLKSPHVIFCSPSIEVSDLVPIRIPTWSEHAESWVNETRFPVSVIRYEDLVSDPLTGFSRIISTFLGRAEMARLKRAIEFSSLAEFRQQEKKHGSAFNKHSLGSFFRNGKADIWKDELSERQISAVVRNHQVVMRRFAYLSLLR